jgi:hypothetical protein
MPSSSERRALVFAAVLTTGGVFAPRAEAQQPQGFAVERFYPSAPGGGWFVMDDLRMHGTLGGAMALTVGYAHDPLRVTDGSKHLAVVSDQAFTDFGFALTYDRWRLYLNLDVPLAIEGQSGTVGAYQFAAPSVDLGSNPDTVSDARIGADGRIFGTETSPLRVGASAQWIIPNGNIAGGNRANYNTDATYRAMGRMLVAGDVGYFTYSAQLGVHIRPLDDSPAPGSPQGSELLFGAAGGARVFGCGPGSAALIVGPEIFGATAFRSFFGSAGTALEGLLTSRFEGPTDRGPQLRMKLGAGTGLDQHFGAPEWRLVFAIELLDHTRR